MGRTDAVGMIGKEVVVRGKVAKVGDNYVDVAAIDGNYTLTPTDTETLSAYRTDRRAALSGVVTSVIPGDGKKLPDRYFLADPPPVVEIV